MELKAFEETFAAFRAKNEKCFADVLAANPQYDFSLFLLFFVLRDSEGEVHFVLQDAPEIMIKLFKLRLDTDNDTLANYALFKSVLKNLRNGTAERNGISLGDLFKLKPGAEGATIVELIGAASVSGGYELDPHTHKRTGEEVVTVLMEDPDYHQGALSYAHTRDAEGNSVITFQNGAVITATHEVQGNYTNMFDLPPKIEEERVN